MGFLFRIIGTMLVAVMMRPVLAWLQNLFHGGRTRTRTQSGPQPADAGPSTLLKQDPVCGAWVAPDTSLKMIRRGKVLHFCSNACRDKYRD